MFNDVSPGNYDGAALGFIGGAKIHSSQATGAPIGTALPSGTPDWGRGWKEGMQDWYGHSMKVSITTSCQSYRGHYVDWTRRTRIHGACHCCVSRSTGNRTS